MTRLARWPDLHVYHYAPYEPAAFKRLMGRHATRGDELDRLLRAERFVDLLAVVRQGVRVGVESYSIKQLEPCYGFEREVPLKDANLCLQQMEVALELGHGAARCRTRSSEGVAGYNRDDCVSTLRLRDWLETLRAEAIARGTDIPRPEPKEGDPPPKVDDRAQKVEALRARLLAGVPGGAGRAERGAGGPLDPGLPPRLAPPRGPGRLVGVLPAPRAPGGGPLRRARRRGRPRARRDGARHPAQEVEEAHRHGGRPLPLPAAGDGDRPGRRAQAPGREEVRRRRGREPGGPDHRRQEGQGPEGPPPDRRLRPHATSTPR